MNQPLEAAPASRPAFKFAWWHAAMVFFAANLVSILPAGFNGDEAFYNTFTRPAVAPPDWLFAPMWLFLNITSLIALGIVFNVPRDTPGRRAFIALEGIGWVLFAAFNTLYFWMKSPVLGATDTVLGLVVGVLSLGIAWRINRRAAALIGLRIAWLLLASYVSVYVALNNADPFLSAMFGSR
jgi:tryptophan-rich sensory protein